MSSTPSSYQLFYLRAFLDFAFPRGVGLCDQGTQPQVDLQKVAKESVIRCGVSKGFSWVVLLSSTLKVGIAGVGREKGEGICPVETQR